MLFRSGQNCDETGKGRSSKVLYQCCAETSASGIAARPAKGEVHVWIDSVREVAMCQYSLTVCMPSLCTAGTTQALLEFQEQLAKAKVDAAAVAAAAAVVRKADTSATVPLPSTPSSGKHGAAMRADKSAPGHAPVPPPTFLMMSTAAVLADTSDSLAWLEDHSPQLGAK